MPNPTGVENLTSSDFEVKKPKILFFDIETAPNLGYVWGRYEQNVIEFTSEWYMLAWSAKWKDGKHITKCLADYDGYDPLSENDRLLVTDLHKLLAEADIVIAHNGSRFDIKRSNTRFIEHGLLPPEPYVFLTKNSNQNSRKYVIIQIVMMILLIPLAVLILYLVAISLERYLFRDTDKSLFGKWPDDNNL